MTRMSRFLVVLIAAALACGSAGVSIAAKNAALAEPRLQLGKKFRAAIATAQARLATRDVSGAKAALAHARSHVRTADEQYVLDRYDLDIAQTTGDRTGTIAALDRLIASGIAANQLSEADKARYYANQGEFLFQAGHHARAEKSFAAALAAGNRDPQIALLLAECQLRGRRPAEAIRNIRFAIDASNAAGTRAPAQWYARGAEIAARAKLPGEFVDITSAWLAAWPDRENWYVALAGFRQLGGLPADAERDLLRLARIASPGLFALKDYVDYARLVGPVSLNDAVALLREGIAAGKISPGENPAFSKLLLKVDPKLAAERKKLAGKPGGTGHAALTAQADGLYGIREFAKAADLYRQALAAGADAGQGNVRLAAALAQSGDKAGALAALDKVSGVHVPIAAYWRAWIQTPALS